MLICYAVELSSMDGTIHTIIVKEEELNIFLSSYDKNVYTLIGVHGLGPVYLDYEDFLKLIKEESNAGK